MKINRRIAAVLVLALVGTLVLAAGCKATVSNPVVAKVGDVEVTYSEFYSVFQTYAQYVNYGMVTFNEDERSADEQVKEMVFQDLINEAAPAAMAIKMGLTLTEDEQQVALANATATMEQYLLEYDASVDESVTDSAVRAAEAMRLFEAELKASGTSYSEVYDLVLKDAENAVLAQKLSDQVMADAAVAEGEALAWYEAELESQRALYTEDPGMYYTDFSNYASYGGMRPLVAPEGYNYYKHILVMPAEAGEEKDVQAIVAEIQQRIADGEDYDALMEEYNEDPGMSIEAYAGGYPISKESAARFDEAFASAAMALENEGDISEPVEGANGTHIIKRCGPVSTEPVPFAEVEEAIEQQLLGEEQNLLYSEALTQWKEELTIKTFPGVVRYLTLDEG